MNKKILSLLMLLIFLFSEHAFALRTSKATYQRRLKESKLTEKMQSFEAGFITVVIEREISDSLRRGLKQMIQKAISEIGYHLGHTPREPAKLVLLHGNTYETIDSPDRVTGAFYANKKIRMKFPYDLEESKLLKGFNHIFRHEYTHLIIASIDGGRTPRWLNEGLAVYESKPRSERKRGEGRAYIRKLQREGKDVSIEKFVKKKLSTQYSANSQDFYMRSYILAKHLVDRYGYQKLKELFKQLKGGKNFTFALKDVYGLNLETLARGAYES